MKRRLADAHFPKMIKKNKIDISCEKTDKSNSGKEVSCLTNDITADFQKQSEVNEIPFVNSTVNQVSSEKKKVDFACQVYIEKSNEIKKTFVCNRYIYRGSHSDVEVQTSISEGKFMSVAVSKKLENKLCGTTEITLVDEAVGPSTEMHAIEPSAGFCGYTSITCDREMLDLAGISMNNFNFLIKKIQSTEKENFKISLQNRLLILLIKLKTGLSFSAIAFFFSIDRNTVSRIFHTLLGQVAAITTNLVFWPTKQVVQSTMPKCFYPDYVNTRVIIDCTEFKIDVPASVDNRVFCYSDYKKSFTSKLLLGITPSGFISFKSKVAGGRKSDSQLTIESGLIDLLEDGDTVHADKGFPEIKKIIDNDGKKCLIVMPPFLEKKKEFSEAETKSTYNIARVRIHVERIIQRLRTYHILNKITENLFNCLDDIIHVCCVLVNLQQPIIAEE